MVSAVQFRPWPPLFPGPASSSIEGGCFADPLGRVGELESDPDHRSPWHPDGEHHGPGRPLALILREARLTGPHDLEQRLARGRQLALTVFHHRIEELALDRG